MLIRLQQALASWQPAQSFDIQPGTAGVASPHRLATEWAGFRLQSAGQGYYAKVLFDDQKALIDFQRSAEISRQAGELGIAPSLCHADPHNGVLIFAALDDGFRWARLDALRGFPARNQSHHLFVRGPESWRALTCIKNT